MEDEKIMNAELNDEEMENATGGENMTDYYNRIYKNTIFVCKCGARIKGWKEFQGHISAMSRRALAGENVGSHGEA